MAKPNRKRTKAHFHSVPVKTVNVCQSGSTLRKERFAAQMRAHPTRLESILKTSLALAVPERYTVYTQWVERGYILDFYIRELKLCFEADGPQHDWRYDERRDVHLFRAGIRTVRFTHKELTTDLATVDQTIRRVIGERAALTDRAIPQAIRSR